MADLSALGGIPKEPTSPFGNGANDLAQPAPQTQSNQVPSAPKISPAPMPQGGAEQAPTPTPSMDLSSLGAVPSQQAPEQQGPPEETQGPPQRGIPLEGSSQAANLPIGMIERPNGKFGWKQDGKIRDLTADEQKAFSYMAKATRVGGPLIGNILGGVIGSLGGPVGTVAGGVLGGPLGENAAHPMTNMFEKFAGEKPSEKNPEALALGGLIGAGIGAAASKYGAAAMLPGMTSVDSALAPEAGVAIANKAAELRGDTAKAAELPILPHEQFSENPAVKGTAEDVAAGMYGTKPKDNLQATQIARDQSHLNAWEGLKDAVGPALDGQANKDFRVRDIFQNFADNHSNNISGYKARAYVASGNDQYPVMDLMGKYQDTLTKKGYLNADGSLPESVDPAAQTLINKFKDLQKQAGAQGGKGMTLQQLDSFVSSAQDQANFSSKLDRTPVERAWGEIQHEAVLARDDAAAQAFDKAGDENSALALRNLRDEYSDKINFVRSMQAKLSKDPDLGMAVKALVKNTSPEDMSKLQQIAGPENSKIISRGFLDAVTDGAINPKTRTVNASAIEKELKKYPQENVDKLLQGSGKDLQTLINYSKSIEGKQLTFDDVGDNKSIQGILKLLFHKGPIRTSAKLLNGLLGKNPVANAYIQGQLASEFPADLGMIKYQPIAQKYPASPQAMAIGSGVGGAAGATLGNLLNSGQNRQ